MTARQTAITLLLRCLTDLDYTPPTWTSSLVARQSKPGEGPSLKVLCPNCDGDKQRRIRGVPTSCEFCLSPKTGKPLGWIWVDGNVNEPFRRKIGTAETGLVQRVKALRCDACSGNGAHGNGRRCAEPPHGCGGSGWVEVPLQRLAAVRIRPSADATEYGFGDPVLAAMEKRERAGDFDELGLALAVLRLELPRAYRTVVRVYVEALVEPHELGQAAQLRHDVGLGRLGQLMPAEIRVPSWAARNERRRRERWQKRQRAAA